MDDKVLSSPIKRDTRGKYITLTKDLYITCDCSDPKHMARVRFCKEIEKTPGKVNDKGEKVFGVITCDDVYLEFNATECIDPSGEYASFHFDSPWDYIKWPFIRYYRRFKAAWSLVRGKPVYFCSDILMDTKTALELVEKIMRTAFEFKAEGNPDGNKT